jgi:hypothetical protein
MSIISCVVDTSNKVVPLGMEIWLDQHQVWNNDHVTESTRVEFALDDAEADHVLKFVLKNKLPEHTKIDEQGNIVSDAVLTVKNVCFDDIDLTSIISKLCVYQHDFNGTRPLLDDIFHSTMGCNGTVLLKFKTPIYHWLLDNM